MQSYTSLSSISSTTSSNSSIYGSQTILNAEDLPSIGARCRSSIISSLDNHPTPRRRSQHPSKCHHLFRTCLSSSSSSLSSLIQKKLSDHTFQKQYFAKLCRNHRLLLVLNDYQCQCGCHFSVKQGTFVILYDKKMTNEFLTVISNQLICSKIPSHFVCDIDTLRERVRSRIRCNNAQSFDL